MPRADLLANLRSSKAAATVRVLVCRDNLSLVLDLGAAVPMHRVELVGPSALGLGVDAVSVDPVCALTALGDEPGVPASCGGAQKLCPRTWATYRLAAALESGGEWMSALRSHPAWPALSFVRPHPKACAEVLASAIDPRWFVRHQNPDRTQPFLRYFQADNVNKRPTSRRYAAAEASWLLGGGPAGAPEGCFHDANRERGESAAAKVVTTARFLSFLRGAWLDSLYEGRRPALGRIVVQPNIGESVALAPDLFFETLLPGRGGPYAAAFDAHLGAYRAS